MCYLFNELIRWLHMRNSKYTPLNKISDKMELYRYILKTRMKSQIHAQTNHANIVTIDGGRSSRENEFNIILIANLCHAIFAVRTSRIHVVCVGLLIVSLGLFDNWHVEKDSWVPFNFRAKIWNMDVTSTDELYICI